MAGDLLPENVYESLKKGQLAPFYLFYGPEEFRLEKVLDRVREEFIPESARDLNQEIFYGDETDPGEIINRASAFPFLSPHRLIIVRRSERFGAEGMEKFLTYLDAPCETTCLIFVAAKIDSRIRFFKKIKAAGRTVEFANLKENQVVPWIRSTARELGLTIEGPACAFLQQIVGNGLRDLYGELEKLRLRHGKEKVGVREVRELVINSRIFTIFELMNVLSARECPEALRILNRFLEEEDKRAGPLKLIGMLNRQLRLLWQTRAILEKGGSAKDVSKKVGIPYFSAKEFVKHAKNWPVRDLEKGLALLYQADGWLKSGSRPKPVLENLFVSLCRGGGLG